VTEFGPDKHIGYAVQWFGMAIALLVIYVVLGIRQGMPAASKTEESP
jgi:cytochrome oxidase assembly protein ShyY1